MIDYRGQRVALAVTLLIAASCTPRPHADVATAPSGPPPSEEQVVDAYMTLDAARQSLQSARAAGKACASKVYASPEYAPLAARQLHGAAHKPADFADPTLASDAEISALQYAAPKLDSCRTAEEDAEREVLPALVAIHVRFDARHDALRQRLIDREIGWGQYLTDRAALTATYAKLVYDEQARLFPGARSKANPGQ